MIPLRSRVVLALASLGLAGLVQSGPPRREFFPPLSPEEEREARERAAASLSTIEDERERIFRRKLRDEEQGRVTLTRAESTDWTVRNADPVADLHRAIAQSGLTVGTEVEEVRAVRAVRRRPAPERGALVVPSDDHRDAMQFVERAGAAERLSAAEAKRERRRKRALENEAKKKGTP